MSDTKNAVSQMAGKIMPSFKTDHGGINLGDIVVLVVSAILLVYTGYRSWHFLSVSIPADFQILALVGLVGIDVGMVAWAVVWIFGSTTSGQDGVSMTMWIVDVIAMVLTSVVDTLLYAEGGTFPPIVSTIAWFGVPLIIVGNAVMAVIYHFTSPSTKSARKGRKLEAKMQGIRQDGDFDIDEITLTADMLKNYTEKRANALLSIASVTQQNMALAELEQQLVRQLNQAGMGHLSESIGKLSKPVEAAPKVDDQAGIQDTLAKIRAALNSSPTPNESMPVAAAETVAIPAKLNGREPANPTQASQ